MSTWNGKWYLLRSSSLLSIHSNFLKNSIRKEYLFTASTIIRDSKWCSAVISESGICSKTCCREKEYEKGMHCSKCGHKTTGINAKYCQYCGASLMGFFNSGNKCPVCGAEGDLGPYCSKCGASIDLQSESPWPRAQEEQGKDNTMPEPKSYSSNCNNSLFWCFTGKVAFSK